MAWKPFLLVGLVLFLTAAASASQSREKPKGPRPSVQVEVRGTLHHGIVKIGAETTGTEIVAGNIVWELDFGRQEKLVRLAERLDGKITEVVGTLERRQGVEVPTRWIVQVSSFKEAKKKAKGSPVRVEIKGMLRHGVVAIGGETTGTTITANRITWELDLKGRKELIRLGEELDRKAAIAAGTLTVRKGVEVQKRWIVIVRSLHASKQQ